VVKNKKSTVIVEKLDENSNYLKSQLSRSFTSLSLNEDFDKANAIFIKPNLTYPSFRRGVTTRKEFIESLVAVLREINGRTKIYIGEGEGGYNSFSMTEAFKNMGFFELEKKFPQVKVINLSKIPSREVEIETAKGEKIYRKDLEY